VVADYPRAVRRVLRHANGVVTATLALLAADATIAAVETTVTAALTGAVLIELIGSAYFEVALRVVHAGTRDQGCALGCLGVLLIFGGMFAAIPITMLAAAIVPGLAVDGFLAAALVLAYTWAIELPLAGVLALWRLGKRRTGSRA
jgi:hypothetical protein